MLELDDASWSSLRHAYGSAEDIPPLLKLFYEFPPQSTNAEPYFTLWSSLCHQHDAYTASYAAVPHLVAAAMGAPESATIDALYLPACIEQARIRGRAPELPAELSESYVVAIGSLPAVVARLAGNLRDHEWAVAGAFSIAIAGGHADMAEGIAEVSEIPIDEVWKWIEGRR